MELRQSLELLDFYLSQKNEKRTLYIAGGAAINLQGLSTRSTEDIDVLAPRIDALLEEASIHVAEQMGLNDQWLNNGVNHFKKNIPAGWEQRASEVFNGDNLTVMALSRIDLLTMKFCAAIDRKSDLKDIISMVPTEDELKSIAVFSKGNQPHLVNDKDYHQEIDELVEEILEEL